MYTSVRELGWICSSLWRICGKRRQSAAIVKLTSPRCREFKFDSLH